MKLTLGFSPCPNDTFIFDALVNHKIDTEGLEFEVLLNDVQELNNLAINGSLDISKISYGVLALVLSDYIVLNSGSALGKGVGPLFISKSYYVKDIEQMRIAIPGANTTAHMLFSLAYPQARRKVFKIFNEIEDAVLTDEADAGVIIHENRFTYQKRGLHKIEDLGEYWEQATGAPVPLGGIVAKRSLDEDLIKKIDRLIKQSIEYAFQNNYKDLSDYVVEHAQEMDADVMRQHIDLYVNEYTTDLKTEGKKAIMQLLDVYSNVTNYTPNDTYSVFA